MKNNLSKLVLILSLVVFAIVGSAPTIAKANEYNLEWLGVTVFEYLDKTSEDWETYFVSGFDESLTNIPVDHSVFVPNCNNLKLTYIFSVSPTQTVPFGTYKFAFEFSAVGDKLGFINDFSYARVKVSYVDDPDYYYCGEDVSVSCGNISTVVGSFYSTWGGVIDEIAVELFTDFSTSTSLDTLEHTRGDYMDFSSPELLYFQDGLSFPDSGVDDEYYDEDLKLTNDIFENIKIIGNYILNLPRGIADSIGDFFNDLGDSLTETLNKVHLWLTYVVDSIKKLPNDLSGFFVNLSSDIQGYFDSLGDTIGGFFDGLARDIAIAVAEVFGWDDYQEGDSSLNGSLNDIFDKIVDVLPDLSVYVPRQGTLLGDVFSILFSNDTVAVFLKIVTVVGIGSFLIFK